MQLEGHPREGPRGLLLRLLSQQLSVCPSINPGTFYVIFLFSSFKPHIHYYSFSNVSIRLFFVSLASLTLSSDPTTWAVPFLWMSNLVHPGHSNENLNISSSASCPFVLVHDLQTINHSRSHSHLVNLPFDSYCYCLHPLHPTFTLFFEKKML